jgi:hypothetical protein
VERVEELARGDLQGIGNVSRYTWKGRLPYRLIFDVCIIRSEPLADVEGIASGDVEGKGHWSFTADGAVTAARCEWQIRTTPAQITARQPNNQFIRTALISFSSAIETAGAK